MVFHLEAMKHTIQKEVSEIQRKLLDYEEEMKRADIRRQEAEKDLRTLTQLQSAAQDRLGILKGDTLKSLDNVLSYIEQTECEWSHKSATAAIQPKP